MSKIHITLVGGQLEPVYQGIVYADPDKIYYICSEETKEYAEIIKSQFKQKDYDVRKMPTDLKQVREEIEKLKNSINAEDEISINLVGGTKVWSIYFYDVFRVGNVHFIVVEQDKVVSDLFTYENKSIPLDPDLIFKLHRCQNTNYIRFEDFTESDSCVAQQLEKLWENDNQLFTRLLGGVDKKKKYSVVAGGKTKKVPFSQYVKYDEGRDYLDDNNHFDFSRTSDPEKMEVINLVFKGRKIPQIKSPHAKRLTFATGWFEYKVAKILSQWKQAREILCGCEMKQEGKASKKAGPLNEFDVIIDTKKRLLFVECKTAIAKPTDIDKFAKGIRTYGGTSSCGVFITYYPVDKTQQDKFKLNHIKHISLKDWQGNMISNEDIYNELDKLVSGSNPE